MTSLPAMIALALDDPALFGPMLAGDSWRAWRAFLLSLFALPLDRDALALYQHHTGRTAPPERPFREAALVIGRRGGKSRMLAITAVALATLGDFGASPPAKRRWSRSSPPIAGRLASFCTMSLVRCARCRCWRG
jgi:hypothetical protein